MSSEMMLALYGLTVGGFTKIFEVNERSHLNIFTSPVQLSANDDNRSCGTELSDLRDPLVSNILV